MLDRATHLHAKRIVSVALDMPADQREAFLKSACGAKEELLAEVRSLIEWADQSDSFLEQSPLRLADFDLQAGDARDPLIGCTLGAWRVVSVLGRGGMGVVYHAERADAAFQRRVAIKVVRSADAADIIERFHHERETLAALDHPNIARLLDAGTTERGEPYFVMEFVDGEPVDRYCDEHRLTVDERLDLFLTVGHAVRHAHEALVVHRDLKPDNILVSRDGIPKLLDFGIARVLSDVPAREQEKVIAATWLMTPDFASPEQLGGAPVTTAADVYSLGVLLHVLLCGQRPYRLNAAGGDALAHQLARAPIDPPSACVLRGDEEHAGRRRTSRAALARRLRGDLDAIVMRALARDVRLRYRSVEQLTDEIERHRAHQPVLARGSEWPYLLAQFARRHRVKLAIAAVFVAVIVASTAGLLWQARLTAEARARAERRFNDVRQLAQTFMFDVHDEIVNVPGTTRARALMVRTASRYLESLAREAGDDLALQKELASAFVKVGDAQGHPTSANIGDTAAARVSYERAIATTTEVLRLVPGDLDAERTRAMAHRRLADVLAWSGDLESARQHAERSDALFSVVAAHASAGREDHMQAAVARLKLGDLLGNPNFPNLRKTEEAMSHYRESLAQLRTLTERDPGDDRGRRYLGIILERLGTMHEIQHNLAAATEVYQESFTIRQALAATAPLHTDVQRDVAIAYEKLGNVQLASGHAAAAEASHRGALAQFERLATADPSNVIAARSVAISRQKVAETLSAQRRHGEAIQMLRSALATHEQLAARDEDNAQARCDVGIARELLGDAWFASAGKDARACSAWRESMRLRGALLKAKAGCVTQDDLARIARKARGCPE